MFAYLIRRLFAAIVLILVVSMVTFAIFYLIPRFRDFHDHDAWRTISFIAIGPAMLSGATLTSLPSWRGRRGLRGRSAGRRRRGRGAGRRPLLATLVTGSEGEHGKQRSEANGANIGQVTMRLAR